MSDSQQSQTEEVKRTIERLIEKGSAYDLDELDQIYHPDLTVVMIEDDGTVSASDKPSNMQFFKSKRESGAEPLSQWADISYATADDHEGRVVVTRKMELRGKPEKFILSIRLTKEEGRWQVIHESVFVQPVEG